MDFKISMFSYGKEAYTSKTEGERGGSEAGFPLNMQDKPNEKLTPKRNRGERERDLENCP